MSNFRIVGIFHRQVGPADEFLLGVISVFLISILSELVQTVLLRTGRDRRVFARKLVYAALLDEVSHFRNIWSHMRNTRYVSQRTQSRSQSRSSTRHRLFVSIVFVSIALLLFVAEVIAVLVTQPIVVSSSKTEYNLRGIQPLATSLGVSKFVWRRVLQNVCVTPIMRPLLQSRNFILKSCFIVKDIIALDSFDDVSDEITVKSWFHSAGSDHNITFGDGSFNLSIRTELFPNTGFNDISRRITYESLDNDQMDHAQYVHRRFIYATIEWSCNQEYSERTCRVLVKELVEEKPEREPRIIEKWRGRHKIITENVTGLASTYRTRINAPYWAVRAGMRELITSGGVEEVSRPVTYHVIKDDSREDGIPGLLSEEGRVAGLLPISLILVGGFCILLVLRHILKPVPLALLAMGQANNEWVCDEDAEELEEYRWSNPYRDYENAEYDLQQFDSRDTWTSRESNCR